MKTDSAIVWFRRDLRLVDNPALVNALDQYKEIIPVYIQAPEEESPWLPGSASRWWLHHSLQALSRMLQDRGSTLYMMSGQSADCLARVIEETGASAVYWNRLYEPALIERDRQIEQMLINREVSCHTYNASLLNEPQTILNQKKLPYRVFGAYWRACKKRVEQVSPPLSAPDRIATPKVAMGALGVDDLQLMPTYNWYAGLQASWTPGEESAHRLLNGFLDEAVEYYDTQRDRPDIEGTSRLSPHLHFGEISPRQLFWSLFSVGKGFSSDDLERFRAQLGWREFAHYTLYHFPQTATEPMDTRFNKLAWEESDRADMWLELWQQGKTGMPIVDAGMRELWNTGWMHNRVRMVVASFLTKNLGIHWLKGAQWFWDTLVDADLANNSMGWQWSAGCGVDAAPYFRVFNPTRQLQRFDPESRYINKWLPEIRGKHGRDRYLCPIVDLSETRIAALQRWDRIRRCQKPELV